MAAQAPMLYRRVLSSARQAFAGDAATSAAWRAHMRQRFEAARAESDAEVQQAAMKEAAEIVEVLRHNVVQGRWNAETEAYKLKMRPETELGSNETIKQGRAKQLADLQASKGVPRCGGGSSSSSAASSSGRGAAAGPSSARAFSTSARAPAAPKAGGLPRPVPTFPSTVLLSDGSSIQLSTTSPRSMVKLTRDPTNHPLWNPGMERRAGADDDESGRLSRFRKRFEGMQGAAAEQQAAKWDADDLAWMSGGREARVGTPIVAKKTKKGKK